MAFAPAIEVIATRLRESPTSRLEFAETIAVIRTAQLVGVPLQNLERHGCGCCSAARRRRRTACIASSTSTRNTFRTGHEHTGAKKREPFIMLDRNRTAPHLIACVDGSRHASRIIEARRVALTELPIRMWNAHHSAILRSPATNDLLLTYHAAALDVDAPRPIFCRQAFRAPPVRGKDRVHLLAAATERFSRTSFRPTPADTGHLPRRLVMPVRRLPVRPDLDQLKHQAKDLLRAIRAATRPRRRARGAPSRADRSGERQARRRAARARAQLRRVELDAARAVAVELIDAIWRDDLDAVRDLVIEQSRTSCTRTPASGGQQLGTAADRTRRTSDAIASSGCCTISARRISRCAWIARRCRARSRRRACCTTMLGRPPPRRRARRTGLHAQRRRDGVPARAWARAVDDETGSSSRPVDVVLETDSRKPAAKHAILEMYVAHGVELPDTPTMALHRGRIDLLEEHLRAIPRLLRPTFTHEEIYPPEIGCRDEIAGDAWARRSAATTLLHMCVDYDEMEIAQWLLDARAGRERASRGRRRRLRRVHGAVRDGRVAAELLDELPQARAPVAPFTRAAAGAWRRPERARIAAEAVSIPATAARLHEYRDVTALSWGERFHANLRERAGDAADRGARRSCLKRICAVPVDAFRSVHPYSILCRRIKRLIAAIDLNHD